MAYTKKQSTAEPGLVVFLIDQSGSMSDSYQNGKSKAESTANAVNDTVYAIIDRCVDGNAIKSRTRLLGIGYGRDLETMFSGFPGELESDSTYQEIPHSINPEIKIKQYCESAANGGTPMAKAFQAANDFLSGFVAQYPKSFPPIVINVTDGEPDDMDAARSEAESIKKLATEDGNVLLFNVHISTNVNEELVCPKDNTQLKDDSYANFLFDISSELPPTMIANGAEAGLPVTTGSRGFILNASADTLTRFLSFGSEGNR